MACPLLKESLQENVEDGKAVVSGNKCYLKIHGVTRDVTDYLNTHPAGHAILLAFNGQDATWAFEIAQHSRHAQHELSQLPVVASEGSVKAWLLCLCPIALANMIARLCLVMVRRIAEWCHKMRAWTRRSSPFTGFLPPRAPCFDFPPHLHTLVSLLEDIESKDATHSLKRWLENIDLAGLRAELDDLNVGMMECAQCVAHWIWLILKEQGIHSPEELTTITDMLESQTGVQASNIQFVHNWKHAACVPGACYDPAALAAEQMEMRFSLSRDSEASSSLWHFTQLIIELERCACPMLQALVSAGAAAAASSEQQLQRELRVVLAAMHDIVIATKVMMRPDRIKSKHWPFISRIAHGTAGSMNLWVASLDLMLACPVDGYESLGGFREELSYNTKHQEELLSSLEAALPPLQAYMPHAKSLTRELWISVRQLLLVWRGVHYRRVLQITSTGSQVIVQNRIESREFTAGLLNDRIRQLADKGEPP
eukprot:TRINITY_DN77886_c0_g1_i1.p1 TRINITY_DN77886_c0_g1~~TRINITY_DN77886_c0_g1_i1.p1  ORF type:complete len:494 (+),score=98.44 TRINITY_DN77886_c0_g1_i1:34-1482(+)